MEPFEPLKVVWHYRLWLVGVVLVAAVGAYFFAKQQPEEFTASALVQVVSGRQASGDYVAQDELLHLSSVYGQLARTRTVADAAAAKLPDVPPAALRKVSISQRAELEVLQLSAKDRSPAVARDEANAYASALADYVDKIGSDERTAAINRVQQQIASVEADLGNRKANDPTVAALSTELQALQAKAADVEVQPQDAIRVIQSAITPTSPTSPRPTRDSILAALIALVVASAVVYLRHTFTDHYRSGDEAADDLGIPKLGEIPRGAEGTYGVDEAFRSLRTSIEFALRGRQCPVVLITGPNAGSGKTHITARLASAFAAGGRHVIAVDADLRRPALHQRTGLPIEPGLGDVLSGDDSSAPSLLANEVSVSSVVSRRGGDLDIVTAGRHLQDPAEALESRLMRQTIEALKANYDGIFVDSPPVLAVVDPVVLARYADSVVLVVDGQHDRRSETRRALRTLAAVNAPITGFVFNGSKARSARYSYYSASRSGDEVAS